MFRFFPYQNSIHEIFSELGSCDILFMPWMTCYSKFMFHFFFSHLINRRNHPMWKRYTSHIFPIFVPCGTWKIMKRFSSIVSKLPKPSAAILFSLRYETMPLLVNFSTQFHILHGWFVFSWIGEDNWIKLERREGPRSRFLLGKGRRVKF